MTLADMHQAMGQVRAAIGQIIVGQQGVIDGALMAIASGGHMLLESVPGLGKTMLVRTMADLLDLHFSRIQCTPDLTPTDILGTQEVPGPIFSQFLLIDEINRATPKTQAALLEAMQEHRVTLAGVTHALPQPFIVFATQNPVEQEGTYPLPEAQLDRFLLKLNVPYPTEAELAEIARRTTQGTPARLTPLLDAGQVVNIQTSIREMPVSEAVLGQTVRIVLSTHPDSPYATQDVKHGVLYGASPRGVQALILAGKVHALMEGREGLSVEDVHAVAIPALQHRVFLSFHGQAMGLVTADLIAGILEDISDLLPVETRELRVL